MNDRHLFRGNRLKNGEFAYGHLCPPPYPCNEANRVFIAEKFVCGCGKTDLSYVYHEIDPDTLSQCTGLKDKNGRLIFDGEIVHTEIAPGFNQNVKVVWHNGSWCLHVPYWETNGYDYWLLGRNNTNAMCVVVGNVHDNPELLKEE